MNEEIESNASPTNVGYVLVGCLEYNNLLNILPEDGGLCIVMSSLTASLNKGRKKTKEKRRERRTEGERDS